MNKLIGIICAIICFYILCGIGKHCSEIQMEKSKEHLRQLSLSTYSYSSELNSGSSSSSSSSSKKSSSSSSKKSSSSSYKAKNYSDVDDFYDDYYDDFDSFDEAEDYYDSNH